MIKNTHEEIEFNVSINLSNFKGDKAKLEISYTSKIYELFKLKLPLKIHVFLSLSIHVHEENLRSRSKSN